MEPVIVSCACFVLTGLGVLILYYRFVGTSSAFESFMDSQSFGVHFLMTSIGVILKLYWTSLEKGRLTLFFLEPTALTFN
jgi:hypothetical protein